MKKPSKLVLVALIGSLLALVIVAYFAPPPAPSPDLTEMPLPDKPPAPVNPLRNAYFGELHLHTTYSLDANLFGTITDPRRAYRFAMGEQVWLPESGQYQHLKQPLDFAAVTDHAESLGMYAQCYHDGSDNYYSLDCIGMRLKLKLMFKRLVGSNKQEGQQKGYYNPAVCGDDGQQCRSSARTIWQDTQQAANDYYRPGIFTTFIGYEYSPTLEQAGMVHRNIIFRGDTVPDNVFSAFDGFAEDLLRSLESACTGDCQVLSIPHNPNFSWGLMFGETNSDGTPLTRESLALRARMETLVEVFQIKGSSECAVGFGTSDEECGFENLWPVCTPEQALVNPATGQHTPRCVGPNDTVRAVLKKGLRDQGKWGFNPFKLGFVGATDSHNGTPGDTEESTWNGHGGEPDGRAEYRLGVESNIVADTLGFPLTALNPGGLTGVWAEENTRESIFDAMKRKESFATSGSRIRVRLFAGFDYPQDLHLNQDALTSAYANGVAMGGDLTAAATGAAPRLLVQAEQDSNSAPLQKIQVIKGWTENGEAMERVYDVVCADGLAPDATTQLCPDNGATVNLTDCAVDSSKGAATLATTWTDPDFNADQSAFYYARVLENPSCRWSQYDANQLGVTHPQGFPATTRQRAWTSPIWYSPAE